MHIEQVSIHTLILDPENEREHPADNLKDIKNSLRLFGQQTPITVHKGNRIILKGNGTVMAAKELGWDKIWVHWNEFTDKRAKAYKIADNRSAEKAKWNKDLLSTSLKALQDEFPPIDLGFDENWIKTEPVAGLIDDDKIPDQVDTRCQPGDLWILGEHRLLCGDSTNVQHVERLMSEEKADIVFTSPPYNLASTPGGANPNIRYRSKDADNKSKDEYYELLHGFTANALMYSQFCYINIGWLQGNKIALIEWLNEFKSKYVDLIIWNKGGSNISSNEVLNSQYECIFVFKNKDYPNRSLKIMEKLTPGATNLISISSSKVGNLDTFGESGLNSAKFPIELPIHFIELLKPKSVLDPFLGSGSTLIACEKTGRKCFGMEIDPHYCDVILTRWEKFTGKTAVLSRGESSHA